MKPPTFAEMVHQRLRRARSTFRSFNSAHEGYAVLLEELDEFKAEVWKKPIDRDKARMLHELVDLAAMCQRAAEDLRLPVRHILEEREETP
jgi:hypothetical protein